MVDLQFLDALVMCSPFVTWWSAAIYSNIELYTRNKVLNYACTAPFVIFALSSCFIH